MWHKIEQWGEQHPVALGVGVFVIGTIIILIFFRGSGGASSGSSDAAAYYSAQAAIAQSGNQLQAAQLGYQAQSNQLQAELTAQNQQIAGQVSLATIQGQTQLSIAQLQADVTNNQTQAQVDISNTASTLTAQVQQSGINAQRDVALAGYTAATDQAKIAADEQLGITSTNAQAQEAGYLAQLGALQTIVAGQVAQAGYQAGVQIAGINAGTEQQLQQLTAIIASQNPHTNIGLGPGVFTTSTSGGPADPTTIAQGIALGLYPNAAASTQPAFAPPVGMVTVGGTPV